MMQLTHSATTDKAIAAPAKRIAPKLCWRALKFRDDAERLTDESGATLIRRMIWPVPVTSGAGEALPEEVETLRDLLDGGDEALVHGPLELFVVLAGPLALSYAEAMRHGA